MGEDFGDRLDREIARWVEDELISPTQARRIHERYASGEGARSSAGSDWARTLLYATSAVLFGAAAIALVFVGIDPATVQPYLAVVGAAFLAAGVGLHVVRPQRDLLVDAMLAAALAPLAVATLDPSVSTGQTWAYGLPTIALAVAYLSWRRGQPFLPTLAVVGFTAAAAGTAFNGTEAVADGAFVWLSAQGALLAGLAAVDRALADAEGTTPVALATLGLAGCLIPFLWESIGVDSAETLELLLGGVMLLVLVIGVVIEHRGLLIGAAVAVGIDAIAFAFTVGGVWLGIGVLVGLAVVMIWQAEHLKSWVQTAGPAP